MAGKSVWHDRKLDPEVRFWMNVKSAPGDACWEWVGCVSREYGVTGYKGKRWRANRLSWLFHFGDPGELHVCHKCDNPKCVRPSHLFLGTDADNLADMARKGRHWRTTLSPDDVRKIRRLYAEATKAGRAADGAVRAIAERFSIAKQTVFMIGTLAARKFVKEFA